MVAGKDAARPGEGKNSWLTGTAAWIWLTVSQYILGVKPDYDGLLIDPCVPNTAQEFSVKRKFRDAEYRIRISNPQGVNRGVLTVEVDGALIDGNVIPYSPGSHEVTVTMG
jgi:cellobiose phosphorylase